jgi:hypothetical protein
MNPKTVAKLKQVLGIALLLGKLTQAEVDAINVLLDRLSKEPARGMRKLPRPA